jgi:anti-sigma regulatory factor (Ser/Thr protein kinase)
VLIRATRQCASTVHHTGTLTLHRTPVAAGFEVRLRRAGRPGEPLSEADRARPGQMRRLGRAHLRMWRLGHLADTAELLISELVTNGFEHGHGGTVTVRLTRTPERLRLDVLSGPGPGVVAVRAARGDEESGRGLHLVSVLADAWGTVPRHGHTWCVLELARPTDPPPA